MKKIEEYKHIGDLIKEEVDRQGLSASEFGKKIYCERGNVYKIYKRKSIDTALLGIISNALNHDFFADIASNHLLSGVDDEEVRKEVYNKMAVAQFIEVVPDLLEKLGVEPHIFFGRPLEIPKEIPIPDYYITPNISLSLNELLFDKMNCNLENAISVKRFKDNDTELLVDLWEFRWNADNLLNIKLDYKTKEEWEYTLRFIFKTFFRNIEIKE